MQRGIVEFGYEARADAARPGVAWFRERLLEAIPEMAGGLQGLGIMPAYVDHHRGSLA